MISLKKILMPTDFSEFSEAAKDYACSFVEKFGAELHLLHVLQDLVAMAPEPGMAFPPPGDYMKELQASAEQALAKRPGDSLPAGSPSCGKYVTARRFWKSSATPKSTRST